MEMVTKAVVCVVALSLISPTMAKGGKGGGGKGFKSSSYAIKSSTGYKIKPKNSETDTNITAPRQKVGYRFGGSGGSSGNQVICRGHGGVSHCDAQGKYVCKDGTISPTQKICRR